MDATAKVLLLLVFVGLSLADFSYDIQADERYYGIISGESDPKLPRPFQMTNGDAKVKFSVTVRRTYEPDGPILGIRFNLLNGEVCFYANDAEAPLYCLVGIDFGTPYKTGTNEKHAVMHLLLRTPDSQKLVVEINVCDDTGFEFPSWLPFVKRDLLTRWKNNRKRIIPFKQNQIKSMKSNYDEATKSTTVEVCVNWIINILCDDIKYLNKDEQVTDFLSRPAVMDKQILQGLDTFLSWLIGKVTRG